MKQLVGMWEQVGRISHILIETLFTLPWNCNVISSCRGSLNWEAYWFWDQRSSQGQISKIINFNLKNNQFSYDSPELWLRLSIFISMKWTIWCIHGNLWRGGWILQVSCSARCLFIVLLHRLSVYRLQVTILNRSSQNFITW